MSRPWEPVCRDWVRNVTVGRKPPIFFSVGGDHVSWGGAEDAKVALDLGILKDPE